ncbi:MAG: serine/threonine protein kinase [Planctomycetes bacterium]|nr:serine/threonine protein kinase [Planctomycetota bacterium]
MGLLDKLTSMFKTESRCDVETRFERLRSSVFGTMSNFYVANDRVRKEVVGVKICDAEKVAFFESRFKGLNKPSEGEIATKMRHPNIVVTYEYGTTTKGLPYLVMEFVDGPGLQQLIYQKSEDMLNGRRLNLIRQMAEALKYVHEQGFIHRDICPRNYICFTNMEQVKMIDFGLTVPATKDFMQPGNRTGTPLYMSPEIVRRKPTDQRVDVFSFGVTCYHLCTFELPWPVGDASGLAALQHDTHPARDIFEYRPDLDRTLGNAIMAAMRPSLNDRTPSMDQFLQSIRTVKSDFR